MPEIGKVNNLKIVKGVNFGLYLDGADMGEILLPMRYVPENVKPGDMIDVFLYNDSEDRIIATTEMPYAMVGDFAFLKVVAVNSAGAFLDWGLLKDLLVPYREQKMKMETGKSYVVAVYLDEMTNRIVASAKIDRLLNHKPEGLTEGQKVELLIFEQTPIGYKAVINNKYTGVLFKNEVFKPLNTGDKTTGYIKQIREDDKIDLSLGRQGYVKTDDITQKIIDKLKENNGKLEVHDKSSPEIIYQLFGESKKAFKMAVGNLYKKRIIDIKKDSIVLLKE